LRRNLFKKRWRSWEAALLHTGASWGASAKGAPGTSHQAFEPGAPGLAPAGAPSARPPQGRTDGHAPHVPGGRARKHYGSGLRSMGPQTRPGTHRHGTPDSRRQDAVNPGFQYVRAALSGWGGHLLSG